MSNCNIYIVLDTTGSMSGGIASVKLALFRLCELLPLLPCQFKCSLVCYRDYSDKKVLPYPELQKLQSIQDLQKNLHQIVADGGGDTPEAFRTGYNKAIQMIMNDEQKEVKQIIICITDAPPHLSACPNQIMERHALKENFDPIKLEYVPVCVFTNLQYVATDPLYTRLGKVYLHDFGSSNMIRDLLDFVCENAGLNKLEINRRFRDDFKYREQAIQTLERTINTDSTMLRSNLLLGTLWRKFCNLRDDNRRDTLINSLASKISALPQQEKDLMKIWISDSYDATEEIQEKLNTVKDKSPSIVFDGQHLDRDTILEISRSCTRTTVKTLLAAITKLRVSDTNQGLPVSMSDYDLFTCLSHLLCPGTMFSMRAGVVLALLCVRTKNIIHQRAMNYLKHTSGKWFNKEVPEIFTFEFLDMALKCHDTECAFLNKEEYNIMKDFRAILHLNFGLHSMISLVSGWQRPHTTVFGYKDTTRAQCEKCHEYRSSSSMLTSEKMCTMCYCGNNSPDQNADHTAGVRCYTCNVIYEVCRPELLNVRPKCHKCRFGGQDIRETCSECQNVFIGKLKGGMCGECRPGNPSVYTEEKQIKDLVSMYPDFLKYLNRWLFIPNWYNFQESQLSVYKQMIRGGTFDNKLESIPNLPYLNTEEIVNKCLQVCKGSEVKLPSCDLCNETYMTTEECKCHGRVCFDCSKSWYNSNQPGKLFLPTRITCPMCKQKPSGLMVRKYNREYTRIVSITLNDAYYHGWCITCNSIKPAVERVCAQDVPELQNWECSDCHDKKYEVKLNIQECPMCRIKIEKSSGCNHISCQCGAHFCWECLGVFDKDEIYTHMWDEHSSIGL